MIQTIKNTIKVEGSYNEIMGDYLVLTLSIMKNIGVEDVLKMHKIIKDISMSGIDLNNLEKIKEIVEENYRG